MATQRLVNTNFWRDTYVIDLDPTQKLLFLYFLTNPNTTMAGVYEISLRQTAFDTGIDKDMVEKILDKFVKDGKMFYEKGWLVLHNFVRHQRLNPSIARGIQKAFKELPKWLQERLENEHYLDDIADILPPESRQSVASLSKNGDNRGNRQSDNSLSTESPQRKLIEAKEIERKEKEANARTAPDKSHSKLSGTKQSQSGSGYKAAVSVASELKRRTNS